MVLALHWNVSESLLAVGSANDEVVTWQANLVAFKRNRAGRSRALLALSFTILLDHPSAHERTRLRRV